MLLTFPLLPCTDSANFLLLSTGPVFSSASATPLLNFHEPPLLFAVCVCVYVWTLETLHWHELTT